MIKAAEYYDQDLKISLYSTRRPSRPAGFKSAHSRIILAVHVSTLKCSFVIFLNNFLFY